MSAVIYSSIEVYFLSRRCQNILNVSSRRRGGGGGGGHAYIPSYTWVPASMHCLAVRSIRIDRYSITSWRFRDVHRPTSKTFKCVIINRPTICRQWTSIHVQDVKRGAGGGGCKHIPGMTAPWTTFRITTSRTCSLDNYPLKLPRYRQLSE